MNTEITQQRIEEFAQQDSSTLDSHVEFHLYDEAIQIILETRKDLRVFEAAFCPGYGDEKYLAALSTQIGCGTQCNFCTVGENGLVRNLTSDEIVDQLRIVLRTALKRGYNIFDKPIKITFVQGGEPLSNQHFGEAFAKVKEELPLQTKVSTVFPRHPTSRSVYREIVDVAKAYPNIVQFQVSLNSTDEDYRQSLVRIPLADFRTIRSAGELWHDEVPNPRKTDLTFTLSDDTPMDPEAIVKILPPELFAIRLRAMTPTTTSEQHSLTQLTIRARIDEIRSRFEQVGYDFIPGNPGNVEWEFKLAAGDFVKLYSLLKRKPNTGQ